MSAAPAQLSAEERKAVEAGTQEWVKHMLAGNIDGAAALYAEDAVLMPPNLPEVHGRQQIRQFLGGFVRFSRIEVTIQEVEGRGDLAFARGSYSMTFVPAGGTDPVTDTGKFLEIHKKGADGVWRYAVDMFSSNQPAG